jgi:hypothetical protein
LYAATGASENTCGTTACFRSNTMRTTFGAFCPTRRPLMYGSPGLILPTSSRSSGFRSMPSMSTASRGGLPTTSCCELSRASDSMVTRV